MHPKITFYSSSTIYEYSFNLKTYNCCWNHHQIVSFLISDQFIVIIAKLNIPFSLLSWPLRSTDWHHTSHVLHLLDIGACTIFVRAYNHMDGTSNFLLSPLRIGAFLLFHKHESYGRFHNSFIVSESTQEHLFQLREVLNRILQKTQILIIGAPLKRCGKGFALCYIWCS